LDVDGDGDTEDAEPVPILPKKTAPKSPQNANYVPVYNNKLVSNYENMDFGKAPIPESKAPDSQAAITDPEETPMLMQLKLFKEQQEQRQEQQLETEEDLTPTAESKSMPGEAMAEDSYKENRDGQEESEEQRLDDEEDESTACEEYTDDDIDEALAQDDEDEAVFEEADSQELREEREMQQIYVNEPITPTDQQFDESHYLPMTPKKVELGQPGVLTLVCTHESYAEEEENHYVEMTKGIQDEDCRSNYEIMCLASTSSSAFKETNKTEPVYMELAGVKAPPAPPSNEEAHCSSGRSTLKKGKKSGSETLKKKTKKRQGKDMPDILKPTKSALASDSSDADDESSRQQLEAKKLRSRSRFSLSDTFRPASYYLVEGVLVIIPCL